MSSLRRPNGGRKEVVMSTATLEAQDRGDHGVREITVRVFAPRQIEPKHFTWPETRKVGVAAAEAAAAFKIDVEAPTFQKGDKVLDREKTLVGAGVKEHDTLELVSAGGGV
jgi:hypothetical protein